MGYRLTPQREMIVEAIAHAGGHVTAEEIYERVKGRTRAINLATVYRTLDLLVEKGLANRLVLKEGGAVYATAQHGPHIHLICRRCGRVFLAEQALIIPLGEQLQSKYHFTPDLQHLSISGLCAECGSEA
jgi:Fur family ferric uptake transcriptional regulator